MGVMFCEKSHKMHNSLLTATLRMRIIMMMTGSIKEKMGDLLVHDYARAHCDEHILNRPSSPVQSAQSAQSVQAVQPSSRPDVPNLVRITANLIE